MPVLPLTVLLDFSTPVENVLSKGEVIAYLIISDTFFSALYVRTRTKGGVLTRGSGNAVPNALTRTGEMTGSTANGDPPQNVLTSTFF